MDKKGTIVATVIVVALVLGWMAFNSHLHRTHPEWFLPPEQTAQTDEAPTATTQPATAPATGPAFAEGSSTAPTTSTTRPAGWRVAAAAPESVSPVLLGSGEANDKLFPLMLALNAQGAALDSVTLNGFKHSADFRKPEKERRLYVFQEPYTKYGDTRPLANRWISINGTKVNLWNAAWTLEHVGESTVTQGAAKRDLKTAATYSTTVTDGAGNNVKLSKTYAVYSATDPEHKGLGYEVTVEYTVQNQSGGEVRVKSALNGPTLPPRESPRPPDRQVMAGFKEGAGIQVATHPVESFKPDHPMFDLTKSEKGDLPAAWAGTSSVYFSAFVLPEKAAALSRVAAEGLELDDTALDPEDRPVVVTLETTEKTLKPAESTSASFSVFLGPRWRKVLEDQHYATAPRDYNATLVIKSGPCAFCTFDWLIAGLVAMLAFFHNYVVFDWGLAIICLVAIVRLCLHPITKRSQVQMLQMSKMGPELEKLKKKYADDKDELNRQMMQFYKQQGFAPVLGCLPMFLQMPIWIALYSSLQTTFELRQSPFLWGLTWIHDLSKPDYLVHFSQPIPLLLFGWKLEAINLLPVLMGFIFWLNQKYTPKPVATTPEQEQQQKMMQWMTLLFPVFLYNGPSGLNLYILTSTLIGIIESKVIRDHIKQREEAEKAGRVIVDAPPTRAARRGAGKLPEPEPKKGGLMGWFASLQERAEQIRREQERGGKRKA